MDALIPVTITATGVGSAVIAGVFFAFSSFVMAALARIPEAAGAAGMQAINVTVINASFLPLFLGTAALSLLLSAAAAVGVAGIEPRHLAGAISYLLGTFGVTIGCNVPRNDRLARVDANVLEGQKYWRQYQHEWTRWNHVRTLFALLAAVLLLI